MTSSPDPQEPPLWNPPVEPGSAYRYPASPSVSNPQSYPPSPAASSGDDRMWGAVAHGGSFLAAWIALGILAPIFVLVAKGNRSQFVRHHAYESLNFQLNTYLWIVVVFLFGIFTLSLGWIAFIPLALWYVIFVVAATIAANNGEWYRYPLMIRFLKP